VLEAQLNPEKLLSYIRKLVHESLQELDTVTKAQCVFILVPEALCHVPGGSSVTQ
jgi:hypothetical protein